QALEGTYIDKKCPFTGNVSIRGRILTGVVQKMKMQRTIVIRRDYLHYIRKYNRFEKRHRNMSVHLSPCFRYIGNKIIFSIKIFLFSNFMLIIYITMVY
ncbi:RS11 protein, partial [Acromyrmex heyeri]